MWDGVMDKAPKYLLDTPNLQVLEKFISCRIKSRNRLGNSLPVRSELLGPHQRSFPLCATVEGKVTSGN